MQVHLAPSTLQADSSHREAEECHLLTGGQRLDGQHASVGRHHGAVDLRHAVHVLGRVLEQPAGAHPDVQACVQTCKNLLLLLLLLLLSLCAEEEGNLPGRAHAKHAADKTARRTGSSL